VAARVALVARGGEPEVHSSKHSTLRWRVLCLGSRRQRGTPSLHSIIIFALFCISSGGNLLHYLVQSQHTLFYSRASFGPGPWRVHSRLLTQDMRRFDSHLARALDGMGRDGTGRNLLFFDHLLVLNLFYGFNGVKWAALIYPGSVSFLNWRLDSMGQDDAMDLDRGECKG
jgi:hypothetical protein